MENEKKWYIATTYSGHELKVKEKLEMRAESLGMKDQIFRAIVPEETVVENKNGEMKTRLRKLFPGYIMIEMIMTDRAWHVVRNTPGVTGFIGSSGKGAKPIPLSQEEVEKIFKSMGQTVKGEELKIEVGSKVKIVDGPFSGMLGIVKTLNDDVAIINIDLFNQVTEVEATMEQIVLDM
jgi:transcription termination/antitermination factor nusG